MKKILAALLLSLLPAFSFASTYTTWGTEEWACGTNSFTIQLGSGAPVDIYGIYGTVSASNLPGASDTNGWVRQTLLSVYANQPSNASVVSTAPGGNNEVDGNLLSINLKQLGWESHEVPVSITFPTPVVIGNGQLSAYYDTQTYNGSASVTNDPVECLDTEAHLTIIWASAP